MVLFRGGAEVASWPLTKASPVDLSTVDEVARLQLMAGRLGLSIGLRDACGELRELLDLAGMSQLVTAAPCSAVEVGGESECSEEGGVEEVVVPDDTVA